MDYKDINAAIPILELGATSGEKRIPIEQPFPPKIYKAHLIAEACPKAVGKTIVVTRCVQKAAEIFSSVDCSKESKRCSLVFVPLFLQLDLPAGGFEQRCIHRFVLRLHIS